MKFSILTKIERARWVVLLDQEELGGVVGCSWKVFLGSFEILSKIFFGVRDFFSDWSDFRKIQKSQIFEKIRKSRIFEKSLIFRKFNQLEIFFFEHRKKIFQMRIQENCYLFAMQMTEIEQSSEVRAM